MTVPFLLCVLMVAASGLHFGARGAALHHARRLPLTPVLAHAAVSLGAVWLGALLDPTPARLLWLFVAVASVAGFLGGVLRVRPAPAPEPTPHPTT